VDLFIPKRRWVFEKEKEISFLFFSKFLAILAGYHGKFLKKKKSLRFLCWVMPSECWVPEVTAPWLSLGQEKN
jgi:hypothetical protein